MLAGVVVNLKSDRPFMTAGDIERRQRQQESFKVRAQVGLLAASAGPIWGRWGAFFADARIPNSAL